MNNPRQHFNQGATLLSVFMGLLAISVMVQLYNISFVEGPILRENAKVQRIQERVIPASRGNIYSADGQLLVTSMPVYDVYWDAVVVTQERMDTLLAGSMRDLARFLPERTAGQWAGYLQSQYKKQKRYAPIAKDLSFSDVQKITSLPFFDGNTNETGLIREERHQRIRPFGGLASRTIGYDRPDAKTGLEGTFSDKLRGTNGKRTMQHLGGTRWKPIENGYVTEPRNGMDVVTTIDARMQDIAHRALLKSLRKNAADHGCVVLVETSTGKIRAIVNLGKSIDDSNYTETVNYAVWEATEPGSTFKLASVMAGLEDGVIDTATLVNTENGVYTVQGKNVKDSHQGGYGTISVARALELSSNTGIVKALYPHYAKRPQDFVDRLYKFGLADKTQVELLGESLPKIPKPSDKGWSGTTLPWMMFGYNVQITPLQTLMFYNAIANEGKLLKPLIVEEVRDRGTSVYSAEKEIVQSAIASKETIHKLKEILTNTVKRGTAAIIDSDSLAMAGKTGTCQLEYWNKERMGHQASFVGFFPADNPQYSCIVVINRPTRGNIYGGTVSAPVFRDIALEVNKLSPAPYQVAAGMLKEGPTGWAQKSQKTQKSVLQKAAVQLSRNILPSFHGLPGHEVIALLENAGWVVRVSGAGRVKEQSVPAGSRFHRPGTLEISLG